MNTKETGPVSFEEHPRILGGSLVLSNIGRAPHFEAAPDRKSMDPLEARSFPDCLMVGQGGCVGFRTCSYWDGCCCRSGHLVSGTFFRHPYVARLHGPVPFKE